MKKDNFYFLYLFVIELVGGICFFCGFFPTKISTQSYSKMSDLPIPESSNQQELYYKRHFKKLVIMVIDALRYDFVSGNTSHRNLPYLSSVLENGDSCLFKASVDPPTVTLPRIKALITGTVPSFLDIIHNFGKPELSTDNFLKQSKENGLKIVFYGDETWISLLPDTFIRSEGTTSFYVSDYEEVDSNVTRNVEKELDCDDWDVMILHYLGLDHIGHLEGPHSHLVKPKLLEMDGIIKKIHTKLSSHNNPSLFIICGDHGMKDSGGHGGTSYSEVTVPVVLLNYYCDKSMGQKETRQIDIVPLVSILLGVPIPADSLGNLEYEMLRGLHKSYALYGIFYNTVRLYKIFVRNCQGNSKLIDELTPFIDKGIHLYNSMSKSGNYSYIDYLTSVKYFTHAQKVMSQCLQSISIHFDLYLILCGMLLFIQALCGTLLKVREVNVCYITKLSCFVIVTLFGHIIFCISTYSTSAMCYFTVSHIIGTIILYILMVNNFYLLRYKMNNFILSSRMNKLLIVISILHIISLTSSSYIEEEHQFWYFMYVTLLLYFTKVDMKRCFLLLILHRMLRCLNQTGDKWAHLPDINDWFLQPGHELYLTGFYILGLLIILYFCCWQFNNYSSQLYSLFTIFQFICIFLYKVRTGHCKLFFISSYHLSKGIVESYCFWFFSFIKLTIYMFYNKCTSKNKICIWLTGLLFEVFPLICLLCKPHNVVILPTLIFASNLIIKHFRNNLTLLVFLHHWLGMVFYFYIGNSNSISTIDISVGYVGLTNYNMYTTGLFIALNTFSAPILAHLLLLRFLARFNVLTDGLKIIFQVFAFLYGLQLFVYSFIMTLQRNHLFVWTVFAPKLLYIFSHLILSSILILLSILVVVIANIMSGKINFIKIPNCLIRILRVKVEDKKL